MVVKLDRINKSLFVIFLLILSFTQVVELNVLVVLIAFTYFNILYLEKVSYDLIQIILPLILVFIVGVISSVFYFGDIYHVIRDTLFLIKPVLIIIIGYLFCKKISDKTFVFKSIIYVAFTIAVIHLYNTVLFFLSYDFEVSSLRNFAGRGSVIQTFSIAFLLSKRTKLLGWHDLKYKKLITTVILISIVFYFSRTAIISITILLLGINGYLAVTRKGLNYMFGFLTFIILLYTYLFSVTIERKSSGLEGFLYKIKIAPAEIFLPNKEIDINNHASLWDHWRAFEAQKAIEQLYDTPLHSAVITGKGVGSLVDLGFVAPLNEEGLQFISVLHNGYAFIWFKSGLIGVILVFLFLFRGYFYVYKKSNNYKNTIVNNIISAIAIYYTFTTLIVTGLYNTREFVGLIYLGAFFHLRMYYKQNETTSLK